MGQAHMVALIRALRYSASSMKSTQIHRSRAYIIDMHNCWQRCATLYNVVAMPTRSRYGETRPERNTGRQRKRWEIDVDMQQDAEGKVAVGYFAAMASMLGDVAMTAAVPNSSLKHFASRKIPRLLQNLGVLRRRRAHLRMRRSSSEDGREIKQHGATNQGNPITQAPRDRIGRSQGLKQLPSDSKASELRQAPVNRLA